MSFLDELLGGQQADAAGASVISVAGQLIQAAGGVQGLANLLHQGGLGSAVTSWIGTGENQPVPADQLGQAIQNGGLSNVLQEASGKLGMNQDELLGQLSAILPHAVDHLTPDGQAASQGAGAPDLSSLAMKLFGKLA